MVLVSKSFGYLITSGGNSSQIWFSYFALIQFWHLIHLNLWRLIIQFFDSPLFFYQFDETNYVYRNGPYLNKCRSWERDG